ncbi:MAG: hypothetical protein L0I84_05130 [Halomonas subglaciescola]|nr:hypothetical protein [Halomonas subglaciescola]
MERYPDIEIYLAHTPVAALNAWLDETLGAAALTPAGKGRWRTQGTCHGQAVPVLLVENAADGFASLWFDSDQTPWASDQQAAQSAAKTLAIKVRCSGSWSPGDDPDRFLQVLPSGEEGTIHWPS